MLNVLLLKECRVEGKGKYRKRRKGEDKVEGTAKGGGSFKVRQT